MSEVPENDTPTTEFDFALSGHGSSKLTDSAAVSLVHNMRQLKQGLEIVTPGELVSRFMSAEYVAATKVVGLSNTTEVDSQDEVALQAATSIMITQEPVSVPRDLVTTVETKISNAELGRPRSDYFASPEKGDSGISETDRGNDRAVLAAPTLTKTNAADTNLDSNNACQLEVDHSNSVRTDTDLVFTNGKPVLAKADADAGSLVVLDRRSLFNPSEGISSTKPSSPGGLQSHQNASSVAQTTHSQTVGASESTIELKDLPSSKPVQAEPVGTSVDSRFVLLVMGLMALVAFVVLCIFLIVSIGTEEGSDQAVFEVEIPDFVPSETPIIAPAVIQAEDYDVAGVGISFNDSDDVNSGGIYRTDGVDIAAVPNQGEKLAVVDTAEGEWLTYSFVVEEDGVFAISTGVSSSIEEPGSVDVLLDGKRIGTFYGERSTTEFDFKKQVLGEVEIGPGDHELRLEWSGNGGIFVDWLEIGHA